MSIVRPAEALAVGTARRRRALAIAVFVLALLGPPRGARAVETPLGEDGGGAVIDNGATLLQEPDDDRESTLDAEDDAILDALPPPGPGASLDATMVVALAGGR